MVRMPVRGRRRLRRLRWTAALVLIMIASALVIWTVLDHGDAARV